MEKVKKMTYKLIVSIIILISILTINSIAIASSILTDVDATKTWNATEANMPQNNISGRTGMFPQYWTGTSGRYVNLSPSRLSWTANGSWDANMQGSIVYCAERGSYVRYGNYEQNKHYLIPGGTTIQGASLDVSGTPVSSTLSAIVEAVRQQTLKDAAGSIYYYDGRYSGKYHDSKLSVSVSTGGGFPGGGSNAIGYFQTNTNYDWLLKINNVYNSNEKSVEHAEQDSKSNLANLFKKLGKHIWPSRYSSDIDNSGYSAPVITGIDGPEVVVLETSNTANNRYTQKGGGTYSYDQKAYVLTALENAYGESSDYAKKYDLNDIQTAYWLSLGQEPGGKGTANGRTLYENSVKYAEFVAKVGNGYNASINSSLAQVIADRANQEYIVGPFSLNYPDYTNEDISYVKSLSINNGALKYSETNNDFEIIFERGGTSVPGANGMKKKYPQSGENFFIKFKASKIGMATSINLGVQFEYISGTTIDYNTIDTLANIYKYYGYSTLDQSPYIMDSSTIIVTGTYLIGRSDLEPYNPHQVPVKDEITGEIIDWKTEYDYREYYWNDPEEKTYEFTVYQPYIKMGEQPESTHSAQTLTVAKDGKRTYAVKSANTDIDLSMKLGGYVWEDAEGGKESVQDGKLTSKENKIPNVRITLYREDGKEINTTKTDKNGKYTFSGLNAMYQYYVKFTYNGQYYQPTTYVGAKDGSNGWGKGTWEVNSNATDIRNQRLEYNQRFEKIGSSPENYKIEEKDGKVRTNETFTKEQLLGYTLQTDGTYKKTREAVIDEFGNLILENSSDALASKMIQYVKDCMIDAYTGKGDGTCDLYPVPSRFLIDDHYKYGNTPKLLASNGISGISILYNNAYYINLGLNPREQSDLAIKKDIEKVTLEINGQQHIYTYDTLENKENAENTWDINLRLSDAVSQSKYYDTNYSRELYKSDYLYKVSDYGTNYAELGKSKQDELEVFVTYKVMVRNQALSIQTRIDEIVDYYDEDLSYVDGRSYIEIKTEENTGRYSVLANLDDSKFVRGKSTKTEIEGYNNLYITGLAGEIKNEKGEIVQPGTILVDKHGNASKEIKEGIYLEAGQTAYVYLTFKVNKETKDNEDWVILDEELQTAKEIGVGKENIVEINGYSTRYAPGTIVPNVGDVSLKPAGIVDKDSTPGNLNPLDVPKDGKINYENFEDDTDKAPNIRIKLNRDDNTVRVISGTVFEDERTNSIKNQFTTTGDGLRDNKDKTLINGVTVQLVELMENGTEHIWRTFENGSGTASKTTPIINKYNLVKDYTFEGNHEGKYAFKSFMPGKYVVRFIYGDTVKTVTPSSLNMGGLNAKSYNGQDYKSTTYQAGIVQNKTYTWRAESIWINGQETKGDVLTEVTTFKADASNNETANAKRNELNAYLYDITESEKITNVSDAKDIESRRNKVNDYSDNDVTNYIAEVLASHKKEYQDAKYTTANDKQTLLNDLMANTQMIAETGLMVIEFEYDKTLTDGNKKDNTYRIQNVDLGLEERPKSQLVTDKEVTNVKLTLANGAILFDAKNTATNVLWRDHKAYQTGYSDISYEGGNKTEEENFMNYELFGNIENIRNKNASKFGLIQLSMDEELMHGATIEITYKLTVTNVGEVDYYNTYKVGDTQVNMCDRKFYYTGIKSDDAKVVTTRANKVIDYVGNNLQFDVSKNSDWKVISKEEISSQGLVNSALKKQVEKYNTIIVTENLGTELVPLLVNKNKSSISVPLVLTQLITSENDSDDLSYRNIIEIVQTSNNVARRMEYSVVGNQNPTEKPQELDSDIAEVVRILPPFGNGGIYIIITIVSLIAIIIITIGIFLIKKKVLTK